MIGRYRMLTRFTFRFKIATFDYTGAKCIFLNISSHMEKKIISIEMTISTTVHVFE